MIILFVDILEWYSVLLLRIYKVYLLDEELNFNYSENRPKCLYLETVMYTQGCLLKTLFIRAKLCERQKHIFKITRQVRFSDCFSSATRIAQRLLVPATQFYTCSSGKIYLAFPSQKTLASKWDLSLKLRKIAVSSSSRPFKDFSASWFSLREESADSRLAKSMGLQLTHNVNVQAALFNLNCHNMNDTDGIKHRFLCNSAWFGKLSSFLATERH